MRRRHFLGYALLGGVSACATQPNASGNQLTLWTMQLKPTFTEYMQGVIRQFPAPVDWVDIPWADMETKILSAIAGGTAPDVVNLNPQFAAKLAERNALVDMGKMLDQEARSSYLPSLWRANQLGEVVFGLPWYTATDVTIFNRQLLDTPPATYADLLQMGKVLKQKRGKFICLLTMDGGQVLESMIQMGMTLLTADGQPAFNNEQGESAFAYWVEMFQQGLVPRAMLTEGHRKAIELYQAGEVALLLTGAQFLRLVAENAPDIAQVTDVSAQITGPTGKVSVAVMNVAVPASARQRDLAVKFAQFLTNDANQLAFAQVAQVLPSTKTALKDAFFQSDRVRAITADQLQRGEVLIPAVRGIDNLRQIIYEELQLAMLGQKQVKEAVASAAQRWSGS